MLAYSDDDEGEYPKEYKFFYKGFVKAQQHTLFSLGYSSMKDLVSRALREKLEMHYLSYKRKLAKIDGLAARLLKIKQK